MRLTMEDSYGSSAANWGCSSEFCILRAFNISTPFDFGFVASVLRFSGSYFDAFRSEQPRKQDLYNHCVHRDLILSLVPSLLSASPASRSPSTMSVTKENFDINLPYLLEDTANAAFIAIDLKLSGIPDQQLHTLRTDGRLPTLQEKYADNKRAAEQFHVLQLGITCAEADHHSGIKQTS